MSNIIADLVDWVNGNIVNYATVYPDTLTDASDSICLRTEPGAVVEQRYMDGSRAGDYQFSAYCKSLSKETAISQLTEYIKKLDLEDFNLTGRTNITCEPLTEPHYVSKADNGELIYTASFHLNYYQGV